MTEQPQIDSGGSTDRRGYEPTILQGRTVARWGAALAGLIILGLLLTWGLWQWLISGRAVSAPVDARATDIARVSAAPLDPRQQATRHLYDRKQQALLENYAWIDQPQHVARIPIARAMQIVVERASDQ